jgi:hypothetical protein
MREAAPKRTSRSPGVQLEDELGELEIGRLPVRRCDHPDSTCCLIRSASSVTWL